MPPHHFFTAAELIWVIEIGLALRRHYIFETGPFGMVIGAYGTPAYLSLIYLMNKTITVFVTCNSLRRVSGVGNFET